VLKKHFFQVCSTITFKPKPHLNFALTQPQPYQQLEIEMDGRGFDDPGSNMELNVSAYKR